MTSQHTWHEGAPNGLPEERGPIWVGLHQVKINTGGGVGWVRVLEGYKSKVCGEGF